MLKKLIIKNRFCRKSVNWSKIQGMEKNYNHKNTENYIYKMWEEGNYFQPKIDLSKKPFSIILPLPNANDPMHMGHALFTIQDIMIRYHRMKGDPSMWLPGGDHAGIETQFVFEKHLAKTGKSRFDFDRETLYKMISDFVEKNKDINKEQMKQLGFSLDWERYHFSLEPEIVEKVLTTFRKLFKDGLIYRAQRIVNFCTFCGTAFSDLEVDHTAKEESLYYLDYGPIQIATTRPETIFADAAVAVNPNDKRYQNLAEKEAAVPLINKKVPIIFDTAIEVGFGTGALKVTPAHDMLDFEIGERHNLPVISCIDLSGKMINTPKELLGLYPKQAKAKTIEMLKEKGKLIKIEPLKHTVGVCYRCRNVLEPLPVPQWYVKTKPLAKPAIEAVEKKTTKIFPERFEKLYFDWMKNIKDWNISRQIVWGPRIPIWYCFDCNPEILINFIDKERKLISGKYKDFKNYRFEDLIIGLQSIKAPVNAIYSLDSEKCLKCGGKNLIQETDTFDTWFLSSQWPVNTLKSKEKDFEYFYPTSVLDTMWDILFFWVGRMMMMGIYLTGKVPFEVVHIHPRVVDKSGKKMSKSKGNVMNPIEMAEKYGADALRMALIYGTAPASDIAISEEKIRAMRNFCNKIWNASRFILDNETDGTRHKAQGTSRNNDDKWILEELKKTVKEVTQNIESYHFGQAGELIYDFFWHKFCDIYLEKTKKRKEEAQPTLLIVLSTSLKLLHPFMPFITEEIWGLLPKQKDDLLIISKWPTI